jgi:hypothetical protein
VAAGQSQRLYSGVGIFNWQLSYKVMGDNLGGGNQGPLIDIEITEMSKAINGVTKPIYE